MEDFLISIGYVKTIEGLWYHKDMEEPLSLEDAYKYEMETFTS